jgi:hypothetical protein
MLVDEVHTVVKLVDALAGLIDGGGKRCAVVPASPLPSEDSGREKVPVEGLGVG